MHVDGASWGGKPFPSLEDVPVEIQVEDVNVRVRDAAAKVFPTKQVVEHTRSYFGPFVDALTKCLGDPPAITAIDGEARSAWTAAGGGATVPWSALKTSLAKLGGVGYGDAEGKIAKALGVRDISDMTSCVAAATFAAMFAETSVKGAVDALAAAEAEAGESCVPVVVDAEGDGGLALVGPSTSFSEVRKQIIEANEDDDDEEEDELRELLAAGQFTFHVKGRAVKRKQERMIRGKEMGDPIQTATKSAAKETDAPSAAPPPAAAAEAAAAAAAASILSQGARRDADALSIEDVLREKIMANSLRRHAAVLGGASGGDAGAQKAESTFLIASKLAALTEALAASNAAAATAAADDLRAYAASDTHGLLSSSAGAAAAGASPADVASAVAVDGAKARELLLPALEKMRSEMYSAAAGAAIRKPTGGGKDKVKRVVILGGGQCGVLVAQQLTHGVRDVPVSAFHVTLVDTKEFYEDTPNVLRLMADEKSEENGLWANSAIPFVDIMKGKGEVICGSAAAIRKDHVLVGTASGVASRAVPFDYLVVCTGTSYKSDIKTDGTSIAARKQAFDVERQRCKEAESFTIVGGGLVGVELSFDLKAFFPDKPGEQQPRHHSPSHPPLLSFHLSPLTSLSPAQSR